MKFRLDVDMDNDAFADAPMSELARIVRGLMDDLERDGTTRSNYLRDVNGNMCGHYQFKGSK